MFDNCYDIKSLNQELPKPIAFNCWKHHLEYVKSVFSNRTNYNQSDPFIREVILFIGASNFDLYTGTLSPLIVSNELLQILENENALTPLNYKSWLSFGGQDYRCLNISDGSNWTLRLGQGDRYVHIHPSRHSKKTIRVKSSSLKSVYAFLFHYSLDDTDVTVEKINLTRHRYAKLPALKRNSPLAAINRLINLFSI